MASKTAPLSSFFFIIDLYHMKQSTDEKDALPEAVLYFYPTNEEIKKQKLLDCGEMVGLVQYFQHDLFTSVPKTLFFEKTLVAHEHYGRHSGFLSLSRDRFTPEEAHVYLKHILDLFNMLYGTWNHVHSINAKENQMHEFLNQALTPIVDYVCNQTRSISNIFSTIEYTSLKNGTQRVFLETKHCLDYLKSSYGLQDGLIGYDNKVLYSTLDCDTTFYLQLLFRLRKVLPKKLIYKLLDSEIKLKSGVSLFRIHIRSSSNLPSSSNTTATTNTTTIPLTTSQITTPQIDIFDRLSSTSGESLSISRHFSSFHSSPSLTVKKRSGILILTDQSGSSEDAGFDTDTMDEISSPSGADDMSVISLSGGEELPERITLNSNDDVESTGWHEESLTDDKKLELQNKGSRSSTMSDEMEKTIKIDGKINIDESDRIHITEIEITDNSYNNDDDSLDEFPVFRGTLSNSFRTRSTTVTSNQDINIPEFLRSDQHEIRVSWTDIPDQNKEQERKEFVLYVQRNSRMMFAGIIEQNLLSDDYLRKLWSLMLSQMAAMETEIQAVSAANEPMKLSNDVKFQFNENTRHAEFEQGFDDIRYYRKIPSEESTYMALLARAELDRNPERKAVGLSRGSNLISVERRLPDRATYSCRRFQEVSL